MHRSTATAILACSSLVAVVGCGDGGDVGVVAHPDVAALSSFQPTFDAPSSVPVPGWVRDGLRRDDAVPSLDLDSIRFYGEVEAGMDAYLVRSLDGRSVCLLLGNEITETLGQSCATGREAQADGLHVSNDGVSFGIVDA